MGNTVSQTRVKLLQASGRDRNSWNKLYRKLYIESVKNHWDEVCKQNLNGADIEFISKYAETPVINWEYSVVNNVNVPSYYYQDIKPQPKKANLFIFDSTQRKAIVNFFVKERIRRKMAKRNVRRVHKRFSNSIDVLIEKLQKKYNDDLYRDRFYKKRQEVEFPLLSLLGDYSNKYGREITSEEAEKYDIYSSAFVLGSYIIVVICGQGVHVEIIKISE